MSAALLWGLFVGFGSFIGACVGCYMRLSHRFTGIVMGLGAGTLVSALAYDLVEEAFESSHSFLPVSVGFFLGVSLFLIMNFGITAWGGKLRKCPARKDESNSTALLAGTILDNVPETMVVRASLVGAGKMSPVLIAAIFISNLSNLPEGLAAPSGAKNVGISTRSTLCLWAAVCLLTALSSFAGFLLFRGTSTAVNATELTIAGGAIMAMLTDTMIPEAYHEAGPLVALDMAMGFLTAFILGRIV